MGRANERVVRAGHDKLPVFGVGKETDEATWKGVFRQLTAAGHLTGDEDGYGTLLLTDRRGRCCAASSAFSCASRRRRPARNPSARARARPSPSPTRIARCSRRCARCGCSSRARRSCRPTSSAPTQRSPSLQRQAARHRGATRHHRSWHEQDRALRRSAARRDRRCGTILKSFRLVKTTAAAGPAAFVGTGSPFGHCPRRVLGKAIMSEYDPNLPQEFTRMPKRPGDAGVAIAVAAATGLVTLALLRSDPQHAADGPRHGGQSLGGCPNAARRVQKD